ncbi:hypothetical protein Lalb_Chr12g0206471 [Lupinus albus]|uniref:Uncharacterized protein n=1 Tax=Lupinus albus TaxID=3870 RepID=A0A6A4PNB4_LUPAL|nr:hypothetical protein Lalb_Chr12g0206471 [Lupinus albus]
MVVTCFKGRCNTSHQVIMCASISENYESGTMCIIGSHTRSFVTCTFLHCVGIFAWNKSLVNNVANFPSKCNHHTKRMRERRGWIFYW